MAGIHVRFEVSPDEFLSNLTAAAYQVALKHGLKAPFDEVELDLQKALYDVIAKDMLASPACGGTAECLKAARFGPWSPEAQRLFQKEEP